MREATSVENTACHREMIEEKTRMMRGKERSFDLVTQGMGGQLTLEQTPRPGERKRAQGQMWLPRLEDEARVRKIEQSTKQDG